jgi:hypothetical protein
MDSHWRPWITTRFYELTIKISYDGPRIQSKSFTQFASFNKPSQKPKRYLLFEEEEKLKRDI